MSEDRKGICRLSVVPMRETAQPDAKLVSELLFGEHYSVLDEDNAMLKIQLHFDNSEGWISIDQHTPISEEYYNQVNLSDYKVCIDLSGTIFFQKKHVHILFGSILPISTNELFKIEEQVAFNGESKSLSRKREFEYMKEMMKIFINAPYLEGGKTPFGIDSGGFIQQVFKVCGYKLARTIDEQMKMGQEVADVNSIIPGDLLFDQENSNSGFIYLGDQGIIGIHRGEVRRLNIQDSNITQFKLRRVLLKKLAPEQV